MCNLIDTRTYKKNEIKELVSKMLAGGIIQQSISPFSSLLLLVRNKNGSWHFYVDFRALNESRFRTDLQYPI